MSRLGYVLRSAALGVALAFVIGCDGVSPAGTGGQAGFGGAGGFGGSGATGGAGGEPLGGSGGSPTEALGFVGLRTGIEPSELGVVVNLDDPLSADIAALYVATRAIPAANVVELHLGSGASLDPALFAEQKALLDAALPASVQALAVTSMQPHTVGCMGASAAFALGFDPKYCQAGPPCLSTAPVPLFGSGSTRPFDDHGVRPAMIVAASTLAKAEALVARGAQADGTFPTGKGYFVRTTDSARSVRFPQFEEVAQDWRGTLDVTYVDNSAGALSNVVENETGLLFYLTGLEVVGGIETNSYVPGALADHLTSFGGQLPTSSQMSALAWLEAGATASYGTAIEPCNFPQKFPDARELVPAYFHGATAVEAYWKAVRWPGEGNFVGEPLARPFGGDKVTIAGGTLAVVTTSLWPGRSYALELGPTPEGPWTPVQTAIEVPGHQVTTLTVDGAAGSWVRLVEE